MAKKTVNACFAPEDADYVRSVVAEIRRRGFPVTENGVENDPESIFNIIFYSKHFEEEPYRKLFLRNTITSDIPFGLVRLDDTRSDETTEMYFGERQYLFARDFDSPRALAERIMYGVSDTDDPDSGLPVPRYDGKGKYAFISYAHKDSQMIIRILTELSGRKVNLWYDGHMKPFSPWDDQLAQRIDSSRSFLAFVSKNYTNSTDCRIEIKHATHGHKTLVTVVRIGGATLGAGIEMYIMIGATILRYERFDTVSELVNALIRSNGVRDCLKPGYGLIPFGEGGKFSKLFGKLKPAEKPPKLLELSELASMLPSLYAFDAKKKEQKKETGSGFSTQTMDRILSAARKAADEQYAYMTDSQLSEKTIELRDRLAGGESTDDLTAEAFAAVIEAAKRARGRYLSQACLTSGYVMSRGRIAETSEPGERYMSLLLAAYLFSLQGKGAHIVTNWDFDTESILEELSPVCRLLGVSIGSVTSGMTEEERKKQYNCDITVASVNEIGLDHLRDQSVMYPDSLRMRGLHAAVFSDADILMAENGENTISIVSSEKIYTDLYILCCDLTDRMVRGRDYELKDGLVNFTESGIRLMQKQFSRDERAVFRTLVDEENRDRGHSYAGVPVPGDNIRPEPPEEDELIMFYQVRVADAIKARDQYARGTDYLVQDGVIRPINRETGIASMYSSYPNRIRHALEAKEKLEISGDNSPLYTIDVRNLTNAYTLRSGLARASLKGQDDLKKAWGFSSVEVGENRPSLRRDLSEIVYVSREAKIRGIAEDSAKIADSGRAVVIGTPAPDDFRDLQKEIVDCVKRNGYKVRVNILRPGEDHKTAEWIIRDAGRSRQITLLTGGFTRGIEVEADEECSNAGGIRIAASSYFRNEAMDEQLRSICAPDVPAEAVTYLSLEDPLIKAFIKERQLTAMEGLAGDAPLENRFLTRQIRRKRERVRELEYKSEKVKARYNDFLELQRSSIYADRDRALRSYEIDKLYGGLIGRLVGSLLDEESSSVLTAGEADEIRQALAQLGLSGSETGIDEIRDGQSRADAVRMLTEIINSAYKAKMESLLSEDLYEHLINELKRVILLRAIDMNWSAHLSTLEKLKGTERTTEELRDQCYDYEETAVSLFRRMTGDIAAYAIRIFLALSPRTNETGRTSVQIGETEKRPYDMFRNVRPNDPCPCGSGKKYKHCHGRDLYKD